MKERQVRARHDDETLVVYQAYSPAIAEPVLAAGTFVSPFRRERMSASTRARCACRGPRALRRRVDHPLVLSAAAVGV
jgi:hypothetical protein